MGSNTLLIILAFFCVVAMTAMGWLFYEIYKAASDLVSAINKITERVKKDTCSRAEVKEAVHESMKEGTVSVEDIRKIIHETSVAETPENPEENVELEK